MPIALTENDRQSDIEHQDDLLLGKTRDELTERELNEMVHWEAGCEWYIKDVVGSMISFLALYSF
jgi:hypothetical protein